MISTKKSVQHLAAILIEKGIHDIVFSPGSRNAPLINTFTAIDQFRCLNIVDERSAGFFALGMAVQMQKPVVIACTSGSAVLNYSPAIIEAYYQKIPLLILTADRPPEWIDQGDGQTIRQHNVYSNYIRSSYSLIDKVETADEEWYVARVINQAVNDLVHPEFGPVHINIPFSEPLYELVDVQLPKPRIVNLHRATGTPSDVTAKKFAALWNQSKNKMIVAGQMPPVNGLNALLNNLAADHSVVVLTETTSNLKGGNLVSHIDNVLSAIEAEGDYAPDMLITLGGQIVSKKIKAFLRRNKPKAHCHFSRSGEHIDTFQSLTDIIPIDPVRFFTCIKDVILPGKADYGNKWKHLDLITRQRHNVFLGKCEFSDLKAFEIIINHLPDHSLLHLSNSTPVRYSQLFTYDRNITFMSNRGTSGIDGVVSTAAGTAYATDKITTVITGDLAFFYDSNAIWNKYLPNNLRIIVINNYGGGIFRFLDGASAMPELETHFEARHSYRAANVAKAYHLDCFTATDEEKLTEGLTWLYTSDFTKPAILEVVTPTEQNAEILKSYFNYLKQIYL
ncbi:MAG: 2-succinyl-5-enolpyruvyl-6-hydroxy-3-cyclohexene-1-carboxylic-acid synthase [Deltaproteobacteria bacterium]|nr:2-succinyl-5-enolpyruvyl-6-hydroxy-3-cyclohexene-1-carboxylic-acid synthase [Deltaproteobacteria bacterium]